MNISNENYVTKFCGNAEVTFVRNASTGLHVTINTNRLFMQSIRNAEEDIENLSGLFGSKEVMEKFGTGETRTKEDVCKRIEKVFAKRWGASDPFSGFSVYKKEGNEKVFIGHVVMGHGSEPGVSEIAYLFHKNAWGCGYGKEAVSALIHDYALAVFLEGYLLEGNPLKRIEATSRVDNLASIKILENLGMESVGEEEKYGALRKLYAIDVVSIIARAESLQSA